MNMYSRTVAVGLLASAFTSTALASDCDAILRDGVRDVIVSDVGTEQASAVQQSLCNETQSGSSSGSGGALGIKGLSLNFDKQSAKNYRSVMCDNSASESDLKAFSSLLSTTANADIVAAWSQCKALESKNIDVEVQRDHNTLLLGVRATVGSPRFVGYDVTPSNMASRVRCTGELAARKKPAKLSSAMQWLKCTVDGAQNNLGETVRAERFGVSLLTDVGGVQYFSKPFTWPVSSKEASALRGEIAALRQQLDESRAALADAVAVLGASAGEKVQTTKTINNPRIGGPDGASCPAGMYVSGIKASKGIGGKYGVDGISEIVFTCTALVQRKAAK